MVKKKSKKEIEELKHRARRYSIKEGIFASGRTSFGDHFISPFAIAINTSNSVVALLSSIAGILGPLSQTFSSRLMEKHSRKTIVRKTVFYESLIWLPLILLAFLFYKGIVPAILPIALIITYALFVIISNLSHPAWFSWMGDLVDEKYRGRWFSKRSFIMGIASTIFILSAAVFLDYSKKNNWTMIGFMVLFFLAFLSRLNCWKIFKKQYEPKLKLKKGYYFSFTNFVVEMKKNNFGRFTIFKATISLASGITSALIPIYLLRNLGFDYVTYTIVLFSGSLFSIIVMNFWGKLADKYGNYRVIVLSSIAIPTIPILWILSPNPIYLILGPSLIGGVFWAGFNLASANFIYDNVSSQKRGLAVSYHNLINGIGLGIGAGIGAILIKFTPQFYFKPIVLIFIFGSLIRALVVFFGISAIKETKQTQKFKSQAFAKIVLKQAKPTLTEDMHQLMSIKTYLEEK